MPTIWHRLLTPCFCQFFDRKVMCFFSAVQHTSTYGCYDTTCSSWCTTMALASKIPRSIANRTRMGHDEAGNYSLSRACHNHWRIVTTGARCLGQSITGWHLAPLWLYACEYTQLRCRQRGIHCVVMSVWAPLTVTCVFDLVWIYRLILLQW